MSYQEDIDIIIPHFNRPGLLEKLLRSIPEHKRLNVYVIDDCSDNEVLIKLRQLKEMYDFHLVTSQYKEQKGAGWGRNQGLDSAESEYVLFADSDDYFLPGAFDQIFKLMEDLLNQDVYIFPYSAEKLDKSPSDRVKIINLYVEELRHAKSTYHRKGILSQIVNPYSKLIKRSLIQEKNLLFEQVMIGNDVQFCTQLAMFANTIAVGEKPIYRVIEHENSLINDRSHIAIWGRYMVDIRRNDTLFKHGFEQLRKPLITQVLVFKRYGYKATWRAFLEGKRSGHRFFLPLRYYLWAFKKMLKGEKVHIRNYHFQELLNGTGVREK